MIKTPQTNLFLETLFLFWENTFMHGIKFELRIESSHGPLLFTITCRRVRAPRRIIHVLHRSICRLLSFSSLVSKWGANLFLGREDGHYVSRTPFDNLDKGFTLKLEFEAMCVLLKVWMLGFTLSLLNFVTLETRRHFHSFPLQRILILQFVNFFCFGSQAD